MSKEIEKAEFKLRNEWEVVYMSHRQRLEPDLSMEEIVDKYAAVFSNRWYSIRNCLRPRIIDEYLNPIPEIEFEEDGREVNYFPEIEELVNNLHDSLGEEIQSFTEANYGENTRHLNNIEYHEILEKFGFENDDLVAKLIAFNNIILGENENFKNDITIELTSKFYCNLKTIPEFLVKTTPKELADLFRIQYGNIVDFIRKGK